jgi:hypothetical protein
MNEWGCRLCRFSIPRTFLRREASDGCCRLGAAALIVAFLPVWWLLLFRHLFHFYLFFFFCSDNWTFFEVVIDR